MEQLQHLADSTTSLAASSDTTLLPFAGGAGTGWSIVLWVLVGAALVVGGFGFVLTADDPDD